jgi:hypothetical protein
VQRIDAEDLTRASDDVANRQQPPESVGRSVVVNLTAAQFSGTIVGVNPKYATVLGLACFPSIDAVPQHVDLAVIATPARRPGCRDSSGRATPHQSAPSVAVASGATSTRARMLAS